MAKTGISPAKPMCDEDEVAIKSLFGFVNNLIQMVDNIEQRLNVLNERLTELEDVMEEENKE